MARKLIRPLAPDEVARPAGCVFRAFPISRSEGIRSVVPTIPISDSGVFDHPVMEAGAAAA
jgi:hypothetical protein